MKSQQTETSDPPPGATSGLAHAAFNRSKGVLCAGQAPLTTIAESFGTPAFVYLADAVRARFQRLSSAVRGLPASICYAVKSNPNLAVLRLMRKLGAGFDVVSGGELQRVVAAGGAPEGVVFSGVGKSLAEINLALKYGIKCFNVESEAEMQRLASQAALLQRRAAVAVRVNPEVDAGAHPHIATALKTSKFGVSASSARQIMQFARTHEWLNPCGIACHIGSQIESVAPYRQALERLLALVDQLAADGLRLEHLDLGGGFGVTYKDEPGFDPDAFALAIQPLLSGRAIELILEPGRFLTAQAGVLLTRVEYLKPGRTSDAASFAVVDAGMNDLLRPALYDAWHGVDLVSPPAPDAVTRDWDVVGPVCESADFLGRGRRLALAPGDLLAVRGAGAYGMALASNYNARNRAVEVMVDQGECRLVRRRETIEDQLALEIGAAPS